ncbi:hypothetical protein GUU_01692 [Malacoplasma iowae 695]|nr:hypothetical protein GUU_01692 [Malacoplasma iowae 695]
MNINSCVVLLHYTFLFSLNFYRHRYNKNKTSTN